MVQARVDVGAIDSASAATARLGAAMAGDVIGVGVALGQLAVGAQHATVFSASAQAQRTWGQALARWAEDVAAISVALTVAGRAYAGVESGNAVGFGGTR